MARRRNPVEPEVEVEAIRLIRAEQVALFPEQPVVRHLRQHIEAQRELLARMPRDEKLESAGVVLNALLEEVAAEDELPVAEPRRRQVGVRAGARIELNRTIAARQQIIDAARREAHLLVRTPRAAILHIARRLHARLQTFASRVLTIVRVQALRLAVHAPRPLARHATVHVPFHLFERVALHVTEIVQIEVVVDVQEPHGVRRGA